MPLFDEINLNPLVVIEDSEEGKRLPNEVDDKIVIDNDKKEVVTKVDKPTLPLLEVEEDEDGKESDDKSQTFTTSNTGSDESTKQWANYYKELGLLTSVDVDKFEGTHEDLTNLILEEDITRVQAGIEEYKNAVPSIVKEILAHWEEGAPEDSLRRVVEIKAESLSLNKIDDIAFKADKELQKNVLSNYLRNTTQMSDAKIKKHVERLEELDELEEDATEALTQSKELLKQEEAFIKAETAKNNKANADTLAENQTKLKNTIKGTKEVITNISLTEGEKKDIESMIFNPIGRDKNGNPEFYLQKLYNDDPQGMTVKMNYLALVTKGFTDWSKIEKKATTVASKKIDTVFHTPPPPRGINTPNSTDSNDWKANLRSLNKNKK